jgi:hypothetical protein
MLESTAQGTSLCDPPRGAVDVDSNLDQERAPCYRGFTVGTSGNVAVVFDDDSTAILPSRQVGVDYGGLIKKFLSSGTTATGIIGYV